MKTINLAGCVILKGRSILLLHRIKTNWYELPGGKIKVGESLERTATREIKEELLCNIKIIKKLGQDKFIENNQTYHYTWFLAKLMEKPQIGEPKKFDHFKYIPFKSLSNHKLSPNMQNLLAKLKIHST